jgi:hypothetical protein
MKLHQKRIAVESILRFNVSTYATLTITVLAG